MPDGEGESRAPTARSQEDAELATLREAVLELLAAVDSFGTPGITIASVIVREVDSFARLRALMGGRHAGPQGGGGAGCDGPP